MEKETLEVVDNRDQIVNHLKDDDRSIMWLHDKIKASFGENNKIPYGTLYSCLTQRLFKMSNENLDKINIVLKTDFK